jgi:hypothetical protein
MRELSFFNEPRRREEHEGRKKEERKEKDFKID